jgi:uncharacterized protein (TIGR03437 family)
MFRVFVFLGLLTHLTCIGIAQVPTLNASSIINSASQSSGAVAPGEAVTIFGSNLGPAVNACPNSSSSAPVSCGGVSVLVSGTAASLVSVQATQISFEVPQGIQGSVATIQVVATINNQVLQSAPVTIPITAAAPGLYTINPGSNVSGTFYHSNGSVVNAVYPAVPGELLLAYGTGFGKPQPPATPGAVAPFPATCCGVTVAGEATITNGAYSLDGIGIPGLDEIFFYVPPDAAAGNLAVVVTVSGQAASAVLLPVAATTQPTMSAIISSATGSAICESGSWATIYGNFLSATTRSWGATDFVGNLLPTTLDGVTVMVNGRNAAISYVSPGQVNILLPTDTALGSVPVIITNTLGSGTSTVTLQSYAPGFFTFQGKYAAAVHLDGTYVAPVGYLGVGVASRPAQPGEIIQIYGSGFGPTSPSLLSGLIVTTPAPLSGAAQLFVLIGGVPAPVQFAGVVGSGLYQINVVVPSLPNGDQVVTGIIGGASTQNQITISIKN